jgi:hypothetical protein
MERATRLKPLPVKVHEAQKTVDELSKQGQKEAERRFLARPPTGTFAIMPPILPYKSTSVLTKSFFVFCP